MFNYHAVVKRLSAPELLEQIYLKGLKQEIHLEITMINPSGLITIMDTSLKAEQHRHILAYAAGNTISSTRIASDNAISRNSII